MTTSPFPPTGDTGPIPVPPIQPPPTRRRGFPQSAVGPDPHAPSTQRPFRQSARPSGLPHRPRGAWFTSAIGFTIFVTLGWVVLSATTRSSIVGHISGRVVRVSPPFDGVIRAVYVREGQRVLQGQLLLSLTNVELQQQIDQMRDELYLAQATLQSQVARLRWQTDVGADSSRRVLADYYELWGDLLREEARLQELHDQRSRAEELAEARAIAAEQVASLQFQEAGQRSKVEMMQRALTELRERAETAEAIRSNSSVTWRRELAQIEVLKASLVRLRQQLAEGQLRAPLSGTVINRRYFVGEGIRAGDVALHICEDDSQEIILYVPQAKTRDISVGQILSVKVPPDSASLACEVSRFATGVSSPPSSLRRHFEDDEAVVAVHCQPLADPQSGAPFPCSLRLGYEVRWESSWWPFRSLSAPGSDKVATDCRLPAVEVDPRLSGPSNTLRSLPPPARSLNSQVGRVVGEGTLDLLPQPLTAQLEASADEETPVPGAHYKGAAVVAPTGSSPPASAVRVPPRLPTIPTYATGLERRFPPPMSFDRPRTWEVDR